MNPGDIKWEKERKFYRLRKSFFQSQMVEAVGVALFDFIVGLVGTISCLMQWFRTKSFYPFVLPTGYVDDMEGPIPRRILYLALYCAFPSLLLCSIVLLGGIFMRRTYCVNIWYCPNALGLIAHGILVTIGSFSDVWSVYALSVSFLGYRFCMVSKIYNFQKALAFHKSEDKVLDGLCLQSLESEDNRQRPDVIVDEAKAVAEAALSNISQHHHVSNCRNDSVAGTTGESESTGEIHGRHFDNAIYNSRLYSSTKFQREINSELP